MRKSLLTARHIYDTMSRLIRELDELKLGMDAIENEDNLGKSHITYKIIEKQYKEKNSEFLKYGAVQYQEAIDEGSIF